MTFSLPKSFTLQEETGRLLRLLEVLKIEANLDSASVYEQEKREETELSVVLFF